MKRTAFIPVLTAFMLSGCGSGEDVALLTKITDTAAVSVTETDGKTGERSETASEKLETSAKPAETAETTLETENEKSYSVKTETSVSAEKTEYINLPPVTEHTAPEISFSFDFDRCLLLHSNGLQGLHLIISFLIDFLRVFIGS